MVKGLDVFQKHFQDYADRYILIGGTACDLALKEAGLSFRATKDLDIVLCVEAIDRPFVKVFWAFIRAGGYQIQEKASGEKQFYRFTKPVDNSFPFMLELFSRKPDTLSIDAEGHLTPIPIDDEAASLSAILLDDGYYFFITQGKRENNGLMVVGVDRLIPLKAKAWLDLTQRKQKGEAIDSKNIRKHKNDVLRLYRIAETNTQVLLPDNITRDLQTFFKAIIAEPTDLAALGLASTTLEAVIADLKKMYGMI